jgi:hypothetical protein
MSPLVMGPDGQPIMLPDDPAMGGAPMGPDPTMQPPPDPMAMMGMPPGGPGMTGGPTPPIGPGMAVDEDHLRAAIEHAQQSLTSEPDDPTSMQLAGALKTLYQVFATRQKEDEQAMGITGVHKSLARNTPSDSGASGGQYG